MRAVPVALLSLLLAGCFDLANDFTCTTNEQCSTLTDTTGQCEDDHFCSDLAADCPSGRRYLANSGPASNACVPGGPPDLSVARDLGAVDLAHRDLSAADF